MSLTSELLPEPQTPVTHDEQRPAGIATSMFLRLLWRAPRTVRNRPSAGLAFVRGSRSPALPARYCAGEALARLRQRRRASPAATISPPLTPGPGPEIDEPVGRAHRVLVVLDDDHGVAQVAQPLQGGDQAVVVARVQADRRLVEDVEHADQPAADLAGQADALGLAAGERRRRAVERQVVQARRRSGTRAGRGSP